MRKATGSGPVRPRHYESHVANSDLSGMLAESFRKKKNKEEIKTAKAEKLRIKKEKKDLKILEDFEASKARWSETPNVIFVEFERIMPIEINNEAFHLALKRTHKITREELILMLQNPDVFPNPRLIYSYVNTTYRIDWDGKSNV